MVENKTFKVISGLIAALLYLLVIFLWVVLTQSYTLNLTVTGVTLALSLVYLYVERESFKKLYQSSWFQNLSRALVGAFLIFSIFAVCNYLAYKHPKVLDLSQNQINTLSDKTVEVLNSLEGPLSFKIVAKKTDLKLARTHVDLYRFADPRVNIEEFDIDLRPDLAQTYNITNSPSVLINYGGASKLVTELSEHSFTNSIVQLARGGNKTIFYSIGHNELDFNSSESEGLSDLKEKITGLGHELKAIHLNSVESIPAEVETLLILGPQLDFFEKELTLLSKYIASGKNLVISIDPQFNEDKVLSLRKFLSEQGIEVQNNLVVDRLNKAQGSEGVAPIVKNFDPTHLVTKDFKGVVFFPVASSVGASKEDVKFTSLATTTDFPASWADANLSEYAQGKIEFRADQDQAGPVSLASLFEIGASKVYVTGNSSYLINAYSKHGHNQQFFLNAVSFLFNEKTLLTFDGAQEQAMPIMISQFKLNLIFFVSVLIGPILLFGTSVVMYRRSRV